MLSSHWLVIALVTFAWAGQVFSSALPQTSRSVSAYYTPPQLPGESNHYIDMWGETPLRELALTAGLTNNHTLLINSHGKAVRTPRGLEYVYYPRNKGVSGDETNLTFTAADLAQALGPAAGEIHNIILSGCNKEKAFSAASLRQYFVNATNVVHAPAGQLGYQPMFFQALFNISTEIKRLYETPRVNKAGQMEYTVDYTRQPKSTVLRPYIAELFQPGKAQPYRIQTAGRELLVP